MACKFRFWSFCLCITLVGRADTFVDVLPIFRAKCLVCHSEKVRKGGLSLESREAILRGGKSGSAIVPGKPVDSLILTMVSSAKMPIGGAKLPETEIKSPPSVALWGMGRAGAGQGKEFVAGGCLLLALAGVLGYVLWTN